MSDWGGTHSTEKAALAGLDVQSGAMMDTAPFFGRPLKDAVAAGRVPQARIDDMVHRILRSLFAVGAIEAPPNRGNLRPSMPPRIASWPARRPRTALSFSRMQATCSARPPIPGVSWPSAHMRIRV